MTENLEGRSMMKAPSVLVGLLVLAAAGNGNAQETAKDSVRLQVVKYDGLAREILKNRGKVVVVDFWADY